MENFAKWSAYLIAFAGLLIIPGYIAVLGGAAETDAEYFRVIVSTYVFGAIFYTAFLIACLFTFKFLKLYSPR